MYDLSGDYIRLQIRYYAETEQADYIEDDEDDDW